MRYKLVKLSQLSGFKSSIYTLFIEDDQTTLFEKFLQENKISFKSELNDIIKRLNTIAKKEGAREHFFKTKEGKLGDLVCALHDNPNSKLRLYCIRFGNSLVILGGGGHKPKNIKALQEELKLTFENKIMVNLSSEILRRLKDKDIFYSNNYMDFEGDMEFEF